jgi:hypothetical protein
LTLNQKLQTVINLTAEEHANELSCCTYVELYVDFINSGKLYLSSNRSRNFFLTSHDLGLHPVSKTSGNSSTAPCCRDFLNQIECQNIHKTKTNTTVVQMCQKVVK